MACIHGSRKDKELYKVLAEKDQHRSLLVRERGCCMGPIHHDGLVFPRPTTIQLDISV